MWPDQHISIFRMLFSLLPRATINNGFDIQTNKKNKKQEKHTELKGILSGKNSTYNKWNRINGLFFLDKRSFEYSCGYLVFLQKWILTKTVCFNTPSISVVVALEPGYLQMLSICLAKSLTPSYLHVLDCLILCSIDVQRSFRLKQRLQSVVTSEQLNTDGGGLGP